VKGDGSQVRSGLPGGGRWIRTLGPPSDKLAAGSFESKNEGIKRASSEKSWQPPQILKCFNYQFS
jgi:hypothetical protein